MVPPCARASPAGARRLGVAASARSPGVLAARSTVSSVLSSPSASARVSSGSLSTAAASGPSAHAHGGLRPRNVRGVRALPPLGLVPQQPRLAYSSHSAQPEYDTHHSSSPSSSDEDMRMYHSASYQSTIVSADLTIATRSLSDLAQVPDIAARLIGPVKKDLIKDVIYNARMRSLRDNGIAGTGVPVDQEPDFATATPSANVTSHSSSLASSSLGSETAPVPLVSIEQGDDCSLTHIELTDDHIRVVFDRACEDYSRWAALTSPFADRPDDAGLPEWLVPVDVSNLSCMGGGCTIILERSRLRSHLLSTSGGRPDLFISSGDHEEEAEQKNTRVVEKNTRVAKAAESPAPAAGGSARRPSRAPEGAPQPPKQSPSSSKQGNKSKDGSAQQQQKPQRKANAFPPAPS